MAGAAAPLMGIGGGAKSGKGAQRQQGDQNRIFQNIASLMSGPATFNRAQSMNPFLYSALRPGDAPAGSSNFTQELNRLIENPGAVDPRLQNQPLQMSANRANTDLQAAQGRLGRSGMGGGTGSSGISQAYSLANQAARTQRDVNTNQQFNLFRENQRRRDLQFISGLHGQAMGMSGGAGQGMAGMLGRQQAPMNNKSMMGNAMQGGLSAGAGKGGKGGGGGGGSPSAGPYGSTPIGGGQFGM